MREDAANVSSQEGGSVFFRFGRGRSTSRARVARVLLVTVSIMALATPPPAVAADPPSGPGDHLFQEDGAPPAGEETPLASTPAAGFTDAVVLSGLDRPTALAFAPDGRVFIAEKNGRVKVSPGLGQSSYTTLIDLSTAVHNYWDRGLLGMVLDPNFATSPNIYVLYTYNHILGDAAAAPRWPNASGSTLNDACPSPPGATTDGCVVSARLSRFTVSGAQAGTETVLVEDWCQQYPSHSIGALAFGADGALYASSGDGASFNGADYGQLGGSMAGTPTPKNPCGDPPAGAGGTQTSPTAEGGATRSQDVRTTSDPTGLDGTIIRIDPVTGAAAAGNPLSASADLNARRIVANGLRNPFRFTVRPGTNELWIGDVGRGTWEEISRFTPSSSRVLNFGWPCWEGADQPGIFSGLSICTNLYADSTNPALAPHYAYRHGSAVVTGDGCPTANGSAIAGVAFYTTGNYPAKFRDALFFADHSRLCIWAMLAGSNGLPDPTKIEPFIGAAGGPVQLLTGPNGDLFYVDYEGGAIHRVTYTAANNSAPVAVATAGPTSGSAPLSVAFDGTGSSDPDPSDSISWSWDLNGDGTFGDATTATVDWVYPEPGTYTATLRVTDNHGASTLSSPLTIDVANTPPVPVIDSPTSALQWRVNDQIAFAGHATDAEEGVLAAARLTWRVTIEHCTTPTDCHPHDISSISGVDQGSFDAPDHEYPAHLILTLTATDSLGASASTSIRLDPHTVDLTLGSSPAGLTLTMGSETDAAPFTRTVIQGSQVSIDAPAQQSLGGGQYTFGSWSDGLGASHSVVAPSTSQPVTYTATYAATAGGSVVMVGAGDIADCGVGAGQTAALINALPTATVFTLGDNAYPSGTSTEFTNCYEPTWGAFKGRTYPSAGNHDWGNQATGYFPYFSSSPGGGAPPNGYYSYDQGPYWHVIVLNSEINYAAGSAQEQWLRADLAANTSKNVLAYWHRPRFSSDDTHGNEVAAEAIWDALYEFGADLVLNGHAHWYERYAPQTPDGVADPIYGIRQITAGTGGKALRSVGTIDPNSEVRDWSSWGVLKVTLHPSSYDWEFVPVAGSSFTDSGTALVHPAPGTPVTLT